MEAWIPRFPKATDGLIKCPMCSSFVCLSRAGRGVEPNTTLIVELFCSSCPEKGRLIFSCPTHGAVSL